MSTGPKITVPGQQPPGGTGGGTPVVLSSADDARLANDAAAKKKKEEEEEAALNPSDEEPGSPTMPPSLKQQNLPIPSLSWKTFWEMVFGMLARVGNVVAAGVDKALGTELYQYSAAANHIADCKGLKKVYNKETKQLTDVRTQMKGKIAERNALKSDSGKLAAEIAALKMQIASLPPGEEKSKLEAQKKQKEEEQLKKEAEIFLKNNELKILKAQETNLLTNLKKIKSAIEMPGGASSSRDEFRKQRDEIYDAEKKYDANKKLKDTDKKETDEIARDRKDNQQKLDTLGAEKKSLEEEQRKNNALSSPNPQKTAELNEKLKVNQQATDKVALQKENIDAKQKMIERGQSGKLPDAKAKVAEFESNERRIDLATRQVKKLDDKVSNLRNEINGNEKTIRRCEDKLGGFDLSQKDRNFYEKELKGAKEKNKTDRGNLNKARKDRDNKEGELNLFQAQRYAAIQVNALGQEAAPPQKWEDVPTKRFLERVDAGIKINEDRLNHLKETAKKQDKALVETTDPLHRENLKDKKMTTEFERQLVQDRTNILKNLKQWSQYLPLEKVKNLKKAADGIRKTDKQLIENAKDIDSLRNTIRKQTKELQEKDKTIGKVKKQLAEAETDPKISVAKRAALKAKLGVLNAKRGLLKARRDWNKRSLNQKENKTNDLIIQRDKQMDSFQASFNKAQEEARAMALAQTPGAAAQDRSQLILSGQTATFASTKLFNWVEAQKKDRLLDKIDTGIETNESRLKHLEETEKKRNKVLAATEDPLKQANLKDKNVTTDFEKQLLQDRTNMLKDIKAWAKYLPRAKVEELKKAADGIKKIDKKLVENQKEIDALRDKIRKQTKELQQKNKAIEDLEKKLASGNLKPGQKLLLQAKLSMLKASRGLLKSSLSGNVRKLKQAESKTNELIDERDKRMTAFQASFDRAKKNVSEANRARALDGRESFVSMIFEPIKSFIGIGKTEREQERKALEKQKNKLEKELKNLEEKLKTASPEEREKISKEIEEKHQKLDHITTSLNMLKEEERIKNLPKKQRALERALLPIKRENENIDRKLKSLERRYASARDEKERSYLAQEMKDLKQNKVMNEALIEHVRANKASFSKKGLEKFVKEQQKIMSEIQKLQKEMRDLMRRMEEGDPKAAIELRKKQVDLDKKLREQLRHKMTSGGAQGLGRARSFSLQAQTPAAAPTQQSTAQASAQSSQPKPHQSSQSRQRSASAGAVQTTSQGTFVSGQTQSFSIQSSQQPSTPQSAQKATPRPAPTRQQTVELPLKGSPPSAASPSPTRDQRSQPAAPTPTVKAAASATPTAPSTSRATPATGAPPLPPRQAPVGTEAKPSAGGPPPLPQGPRPQPATATPSPVPTSAKQAPTPAPAGQSPPAIPAKPANQGQPAGGGSQPPTAGSSAQQPASIFQLSPTAPKPTPGAEAQSQAVKPQLPPRQDAGASKSTPKPSPRVSSSAQSSPLPKRSSGQPSSGMGGSSGGSGATQQVDKATEHMSGDQIRQASKVAAVVGQTMGVPKEVTKQAGEQLAQRKDEKDAAKAQQSKSGEGSSSLKSRMSKVENDTNNLQKSGASVNTGKGAANEDPFIPQKKAKDETQGPIINEAPAPVPSPPPQPAAASSGPSPGPGGP